MSIARPPLAPRRPGSADHRRRGARSPHRTHDDDRPIVGHGEIQEPREFFEGVSAARHDHAVEFAVGREEGDEVPRQPGAIVQRKDRAWQIREGLGLHSGQTVRVSDSPDQSFAPSRPVALFAIVPPVATTRTRGRRSRAARAWNSPAPP